MVDNPSVPIDFVDQEGQIQSCSVKKIYYLNLVFQLQHDGDVEYHHFRITMTRNGVLSIEEI